MAQFYSIVFLMGALQHSSSNFAMALSTPYGQTTRNIATQVLQGAGMPTVDLNKYNLALLDEIEQEWTASVVQKATEQEGKVYLKPKNDRDLFADLVNVVFPRKPGSGVGIQLFEVAGGRDDGIGITLVEGLVAGGAAEGAEILPGDSLVEVSVIKSSSLLPSKSDDESSASILTQEQQVISASLECLSYDATVQALSQLPPATKQGEELYQITLKRLRRKPKLTVNLQYPPSENLPDDTITMYAGENLRQGMLIRGVKLNDELAKRFDTKSSGNCGAGGLCRTCAVSITSGQEMLNPQRIAEQQMLSDTPRWRLACKAIVGYGMQEGELNVRVNPNQWD